MEFMLSEASPIYSGGLGNVAGDQLKTASNLGVPVVGIGLLYQQGYFRQQVDAGGRQQVLYPFNDPGQLPIRPLREANGEWVRFSIPFPGTALWIRAWQVQIDDREDAALRFHRGVGRLIQHAPHMLVALGTAVTVVDPRTLLVAGTGAHPRGEMLR
jgi:glucan phosphorylase